MTQNTSAGMTDGAEGEAPVAGIDAEPDLNIDHLNQDGCTALFTAICHQHLGCCKRLLAAGAKTNVCHEGSSYLHAAMALSSIAVKISVLIFSDVRGNTKICPNERRKIVHFPFLWLRCFLNEELLLQFVTVTVAHVFMSLFLVAFSRVFVWSSLKRFCNNTCHYSLAVVTRCPNSPQYSLSRIVLVY